MDNDDLQSYKEKLNYWSKFEGVLDKKCIECGRYVLPIKPTYSLPIRPIYEENVTTCSICQKKEERKKNDNLFNNSNPMSKTPREEVYKALDSEREYQSNTAKKWNHQGNPSIAAELLMMEHYLQIAREKWAGTSDNKEVLDIMRKISGITVRCFENYGVPFRSL